jgi:cyclopropane fatty-acyl-phospholipid synthase-like methyltransferase
MAEVIIKIADTSDHDQMAELKRYIFADKMYSALHEISFNMRKKFNHRIDCNTYQDQYDLLDAIFNEINGEIHDNGIDIDELS